MPIRWCIGIGERLPLPDSLLRGVLIMTALEWAGDPRRCIAEARRAVQPGGWLVVGYLPAGSTWAALYRRLADEGTEPWRSARFFTRAGVEALVGSSADAAEGAAYLPPWAPEPWEKADDAGRRAGNQPALEVLRWDLES